MKVFGGIAGSDEECSGSETCNNCDKTAMACNEVRIYNNTECELDILSDSTNGPILVRHGDRDTLDETNGDIPSGSSARLTIKWKNICDAADGGTDGCNTNANVTLTVGVDGNDDGDLSDDEDDTTTIQFFITKPEDTVTTDTVGNCDDQNTKNGVCSFIAFPGDQKVFMDDLQFGEPNFNTSGQVEFNRLRVYISTEGFASALPGLSDIPPKNLQFSSLNEDSNEFHVNDKSVGGLKNDITYFFRIAVMDEANNIAYFTSEDHIKSITACNEESGAFNADECPYSAVPQEVYGLLSKDVNCFIATAAYGSSLSPKVDTFRQFRDQILLPHSLGKALVQAYYKYSPPLAQWIAPKKAIRAIVRVILWPTWGFAVTSLRLGLRTTIWIFSLITVLFVFIASILFRKGGPSSSIKPL